MDEGKRLQKGRKQKEDRLQELLLRGKTEKEIEKELREKYLKTEKGSKDV